MTENILVAAAWPYASADIHVGNITGSYLPADIFARYQRLKGNQVLMVSGSDAHGTPITVKSDAENCTPVDIYKRYHADFLKLFLQLGLTYDMFTATHTENHQHVAQTMFLALKENGYLYEETQKQWYSSAEKRFLPDRYVEGTCYICGYEKARGDQCDHCGSLLESNQLINPRSKNDGSTPELRETTHFFLDLAKLEPGIVEFLEKREEFWRPNVIRQSLGQIKANPLHGRAITRDLDWGIPVPVEGWEDKCLYVWFEAVIGYLSAPIEWSKISGDEKAWQSWWTNPDAKGYYFIGKDNIPFHAMMWPAELQGAGETFVKLFAEEDGKTLTQPFNVPANEFMNMEDKKISGSANWGVWGLDFLERYDPDPLRFYLTINMPESKDTNWDWDDFISKNNSLLVANWGNLANRVLGFAYKHWEGQVPQPGELRPEDKAVIEAVENGLESVGMLIEQVKLRAAIQEALRVASEVNKYLDDMAPWSAVKTDKEAAAKTIYSAIRCIDTLKTIFSPFLPHTCETLNGILGFEQTIFGSQFTEVVEDKFGSHEVLRYDGTSASGSWAASELKGGEKFNKPAPLFKKLEPTAAEEERARLAS